MKKFRNLLLSVLALFAVVSCGGEEGGSGNAFVEGFQDVEAIAAEFKGLGAGKKIYATTVGQAEFNLCKDYVGDAVEEFEDNNLLTAADVEDGALVVMVIGYTGKGISGNITKASEVARVEGFAAAAGEGKFDIVALMLGGKQRRGENTDAFMQSIFPVSEVAFVWNDYESATNAANYDGKIPSFAGDTTVYYFSDDTVIGDFLAEILQ